ncbi:hypothetical protein [Parachlamydia sp. AcF125]|uniref:hypothetical protein n=1 Tax=Parachlamydia sp. AcF125 TaxID=2795736 RepID=UPI001BC8ECF6|nr:hypothetical protein [Parachlamydia sp. AcF125]MBS4167794.1 hypothetical protein [Parachlamydia sp. AcF125]
MSDFYERQLNFILKKIEEYELNKIPLSCFVYECDGVLCLMEEGVNPILERKIRAYWWELEQVQTTTYAHEQKTVDFNEQKIIEEALEGIKQLIHRELLLIQISGKHSRSLRKVEQYDW